MDGLPWLRRHRAGIWNALSYFSQQGQTLNSEYKMRQLMSRRSSWLLERIILAPGRGCSQSSYAPALRSHPTLRTVTCSRSAAAAAGSGTNARAGRASQKSSQELFFQVCRPTRSRTSSISHSTRAATSLRQTTPYSEERYPNPESTARHASNRPTGGRAVAAVRITEGDAPP